MKPPRVSRREALAGLAGAAICHATASDVAFAQAISSSGEGAAPVFSPSGPNAAYYGADDGYPVPGYLRALSDGNPWRPKYRVGAFSHFDEIFTTRRIN